VVTRSRVVPGVSSVIDTFRPASMFMRDDLPTLGRPTMAIFGNTGQFSAPHSPKGCGKPLDHC
jgi:hypothetical protein